MTTFEELLARDGYFVYTNVGGSMLPLLRQRQDIIEIHAKGPERCKKYDVALYKRGEKYILHRVLKVLPQGYLIAGDNNAFIERDVTDDMILGVMTRVLRNGKSITPDKFWYRCYVHLWCDCYPLRFFILRALRIAWAVGHRIKVAVKKKAQ
ncbi:MAG: S26 family signal peptidase [Clostridia bacterium]|nr:S26 family signal peptidase [Clostridia bacterium]